MIRFYIKERIADKEFKEGRRITIEEIVKETGVSRPTLSRMINTKGYKASTDVLDKLCRYFDCKLSDLTEYIKD